MGKTLSGQSAKALSFSSLRMHDLDAHDLPLIVPLPLSSSSALNLFSGPPSAELGSCLFKWPLVQLFLVPSIHRGLSSSWRPVSCSAPWLEIPQICCSFSCLTATLSSSFAGEKIWRQEPRGGKEEEEDQCGSLILLPSRVQTQ